MTAARMNNGKPELGYILEFPTALEGFARVKMLGAAKYERGNWKKGGKPDEEYLSACLRHLAAFVSGEKFAEDSGCHHLSHAAWNLFALLELNYPGETHDPELFTKMLEYWKQKKQAKEMDERLNRSQVKFEIKDAEKSEAFKAFEEKYLDPRAGDPL